MWRTSRPWRLVLVAALALPATCGAPLHGQAWVAPVRGTPESSSANVDSCAVWVSPDGMESLLFVTEKEGDRVQVWRAHSLEPYTPRPYLGSVENGSGPGDFDRPNGVWVVYHVPVESGFTDVLLVTDQRNQRVQIFRLPQLDYFGEFGTGEVGKGYGIAWYQDGSDFYVFITDTIPPESFPGKVKKYRLRPDGDHLSADLVAGFGSETGSPALGSVESMVADFPNNRLHLCGDEGGDENWVFRLDGAYTGITYGSAQFQHNPEGINLYDTRGREGYLVVSDQYTSDPNQFELFDRRTLRPLGYFQSPPGGSLVTENTDGTFLEQRPLPGFPNGAFFAVHDDQSVHVYDWTTVAEEMGLRIVALDRPFSAGAPPEDTAKRVERVLWFHDGSWWAALSAGGRLKLWRLQDGTFAPLTDLGAAVEGVAVSAGEDSLDLLTLGNEPAVRRFAYVASGRRYSPRGTPATLSFDPGDRVDFLVRRGAGGDGDRGFVAWEEGGSVHVRVSEEHLDGWVASPVVLGTSAPAEPRLLDLPEGVGVVWPSASGVRFRYHRDGDPVDAWSTEEVVTNADTVACDAAPGGDVVVAVGVASDGTGTVARRDPGAGWTSVVLEHAVRDPTAILDAELGRAHVFFSKEVAGRQQLWRASLDVSDLDAEPQERFLAEPGVDLTVCLAPRVVAASAPDLVLASVGSDGLGYFSRLDRERSDDRQPPVTSQHSPPPGASGVEPGDVLFYRVTDDRAGVDPGSHRLLVNGVEVTPVVRGVPSNLVVSFPLPPGLGPVVRVRIEAADLAADPHVMVPFEYQFQTVVEGTWFRRGDVNGDVQIDLSDGISLLLALYATGDDLDCPVAADMNDDEDLDTSDALFLFSFLFLGGDPLPEPSDACGPDPSPGPLLCPDRLPCW